MRDAEATSEEFFFFFRGDDEFFGSLLDAILKNLVPIPWQRQGI